MKCASASAVSSAARRVTFSATSRSASRSRSKLPRRRLSSASSASSRLTPASAFAASNPFSREPRRRNGFAPDAP